MRTFNFRARNIGEEKYLSYTMGEDCELDEDVLDYCQDNAPEELIEIIYEEDDDYASAEIEEGDLSEVVYKDYQYEPEPDPEAYTTCSECGKPLSVYNDFNGKCPECAALED